MATITYILHDGAKHIANVEDGLSVMEGAVRNNVPGIDAECGGACACATCHVYVEESWLALTGVPSPLESSMLEFAEGVKDTSRLSCQIKVHAGMTGLVVRIPESQH